MREGGRMKRDTDIIFMVLIVILFFMICVFYKLDQPRIIKDYNSFAIVEINGQRYVWVKDVYNEGYYVVDEEEIIIDR